MEWHEKIVAGGGLSREQVQAAVCIAAVVHATAAVLDGEGTIAGEAEAIAQAA